MNMFTVRMWVPNRRGRADLHLTNSAISDTSVIHISVSEATPLETASITGPEGLWVQTFRTNFGAASITVQNVSVRDGAVDFNVFVDSPQPLNIVADITILDPPAGIVIGT
jgi:hypothetical protein